MYLKSLELIGFKSFAKKTELTFTTPITAVVGPNGSGKSNIAEAFRFVLGEQSMKSMRGKRTEDLIWSGSPELARQNRAGVKLIFDNRKRLLALDFDEVTIERVIYRDASSEYMLNGSPVRLRDIIELLSGAHIGVSGHHIISQGEADRILNANMRERREMIEDALGLKIYQWKREESERRLEKTEENMKQVASLRREIAPHISFLKKQVEKIEKMRELKAYLRGRYSEYLKREHTYIEYSKTEIANEEHDPRRELMELEQKLLASKKILERTHGKDVKTKAIISLEERLQKLRGERERLSREVGRIEGGIAAAERMRNTDDVRGGSEAFVPLYEVAALAKNAEAAALEQDAGVLRRLLEKLGRTIAGLVEKYRKKPHPAEIEVEAEIRGLREKKQSAEKELSEIEQSEREQAAEEKKLRAEIEEEKDSNREAEKEVFRIMARQNEVRGVLNALAVRMREIEHLEGDFKREITEGVLLVGRELAEYQKVEVRDKSGKILGVLEIACEEREKQEERRREVEKLKIRIEDAGAGGGADVQKEFQEARLRDEFLAREVADLEQSAKNLHGLISELSEKLDGEFRDGIERINREFQKFFELMFGGGGAKLVLTVSERRARRAADELLLEENPELAAVARDEGEDETGIDIFVSLPRKKIKGLMMLSGGERALTSIALLFAMSQVKPPPFIILDETDAALDEANSRKYGDMVANLSNHSQLILITHNRETMSRAGVIYGVTMDRSGVSKLLSIAFDKAVAVAK